jgi:protein-S-isoprenylcysteine O-methyltransferase Ste14
MRLFLKNLLFTLVVSGTVAVYLPLFIAQSRPPTSGPLFVLALALFALNGAIYAWCVWDFAIFGRGTPAPIDTPKRLVVRGLYRYTRNPMYVGVLTVILGWAVLFQAAAVGFYGLIVGSCFHLFIVLYEERHLQQEFGGDYEDYRSRVSRWLPKSDHGTFVHLSGKL